MDSSVDGLVSLCCMSLCCLAVLGAIMSATFVKRMGRMVGGARQSTRRFKSRNFGRRGGGDGINDLFDVVDSFLK